MVLLLLCTLSAFAQNKVITVSGRVVEEDTKEPVEMATVQLLALPDSTQAAGITTQKQGAFTLPKVKAGKYVLKISYIGFITQNIPLQLSEKAPAKNVGTIELQSDAVMLSDGKGGYYRVQCFCLSGGRRGHVGGIGKKDTRSRSG